MGRSSSLLISITAEEVPCVRRALHDVSNTLEVDFLTAKKIPAVDDEVDVEPKIRNVLDVLDLVLLELLEEVVLVSVSVSKKLLELSYASIPGCKALVVVVD